MDDISLARFSNPEDHDKTVKMGPETAETPRDCESTRSLSTSASSIDAHREISPTMSVSSGTPVSAPVSIWPTDQTDDTRTEVRSQAPKRLTGCNFINGNQPISQPSPLSASRTRPSAYELEATTVSKTAANGNFKAYRPGSTPQRSSEKLCDRRNGQGDGTPSRSTVLPQRLSFGGIPPATAIHHSTASDANKRRCTTEGNGSDPFLGTGRPMEPFPSGPLAIRRVTTTETPSPSVTRFRSSQLDGNPSLLGLHDSQEEILSLLNKLQNAHRTQTNKEVDAALVRCQDDLRARSKDKAIGTAEANILEREAARIGRSGCTPTKLGPDTEDAAALFSNLRREVTRVVDDARAALEAAAQAKSQAASSPASRETKYIPYRVGDSPRVAGVSSEERQLRTQLDQLQAEKEQACKDMEQACKDMDQVRKEYSDLLRTVEGLNEEVKAYRRNYSMPWGREWNVGSRRSE